ncbi:MAG TPA: phosphatidylglycerol lysyltransferase domain-containing protein [Solirubrobacteraceae bacterium]|nr:phosphatidylglycerol lysyltransferase domain-containing protein [Solirubrobacteraceae bacterium]
MGARLDLIHLRRPAAFAVAVLALESVLYGLGGRDVSPGALGGLHAAWISGAVRAAALLVGLALLVLTPRLWRGTRTAVTLTIAGLVALAVLNAGHGRPAAAALQAGLALMLALSRRAFRLGCSNRPRPAIVLAAALAWGLAVGALLLAPLVRSAAGHVLAHVLHHPAAPAVHLAAGTAWLAGAWGQLIEVLIAAAAVSSVLAVRSLVSPARATDGHSEHEDLQARAIVDTHGTDSLTPFLLRPDKALAFAADGVLSYRVIGGTAVVSADPVAPGDGAGDVLAGFQELARRQGWDIAVWGASGRHLAAYRRLGLRAICVGEEAFVDPSGFSLEGRAVRKLRQSVHRITRRGWTIDAYDGRDVDAALEAEIEALADRWRLDHPQLHGFAMGMGQYPSPMRPDDVYVLARSPEGELGAVMRFAGYAGSLSLDTMHRVGETPNGLNEALVVRALEVARERGIAEVSLNYAGLAHLVRGEPSRSRLGRALTRLALAPLHRRFQMDRLVRFNEKFSPQWRPRYLVYESRTALPRAILRVLQAEGYLPEPRPSLLLAALPRLFPARARQRGALGEPR